MFRGCLISPQSFLLVFLAAFYTPGAAGHVGHEPEIMAACNYKQRGFTLYSPCLPRPRKRYLGSERRLEQPTSGVISPSWYSEPLVFNDRRQIGFYAYLQKT